MLKWAKWQLFFGAVRETHKRWQMPLNREQRGTGGITPTRPLSEITFYDVYKAVDPIEDDELFHFHENPNPDCPVGRNIHNLLNDKLDAIQKAMEDEMKKYTIEDLHKGMENLLEKEA